jgi:hypothetical protein
MLISMSSLYLKPLFMLRYGDISYLCSLCLLCVHLSFVSLTRAIFVFTCLICILLVPYLYFIGVRSYPSSFILVLCPLSFFFISIVHFFPSFFYFIFLLHPSTLSFSFIVLLYRSLSLFCVIQ